MANCWFCCPTLAAPLFLSPALSIRLRHTFWPVSLFLAFFFVSALGLFTFSRSNSPLVIFQAVFQPHTQWKWEREGVWEWERDTHIKRALPTLNALFAASSQLLSAPAFVPHKFALKCISNSARNFLPLPVPCRPCSLSCCCLVLRTL